MSPLQLKCKRNIWKDAHQFFTVVLVVPFPPSPDGVDRLALPVTYRGKKENTFS
jgi:hypothetical protein